MNIEDIRKKFNLIEENYDKQIDRERINIKLNFIKKLYEKGFSEIELENILNIINSSEIDIQAIKDNLFKIDDGKNMDSLNDTIRQIKDRQKRLRKELQNQVNKVLKEKKEPNH